MAERGLLVGPYPSVQPLQCGSCNADDPDACDLGEVEDEQELLLWQLRLGPKRYRPSERDLTEYAAYVREAEASKLECVLDRDAFAWRGLVNRVMALIEVPGPAPLQCMAGPSCPPPGGVPARRPEEWADLTEEQEGEEELLAAQGPLSIGKGRRRGRGSGRRGLQG